MHESVWSKRRLAGIACIDKPTRTFANRNGVTRAQFHEQIVWMLAIDQWFAFVRFTCLEKQRRAAGRESKRLRAEHRAQLECSGTSAPHRGRHEPVCRFKLG